MFPMIRNGPSYRFLKYFICALSGVYIGVAIYTNPIYPGYAHKKEVYPFFSWFLFAYIPNPSTDYTLELHSFGKEIYTPPVPFKEMSFVFKKTNSGSTEYTHIVKFFGSAIQFGDEKDVRMYKEKLEKIFLDTPATYEIFAVYNDQISVWKTGAYSDKRSLGIFEYRPQ